jgi:hypothetical protein
MTTPNNLVGMEIDISRTSFFDRKLLLYRTMFDKAMESSSLECISFPISNGGFLNLLILGHDPR